MLPCAFIIYYLRVLISRNRSRFIHTQPIVLWASNTKALSYLLRNCIIRAYMHYSLLALLFSYHLFQSSTANYVLSSPFGQTHFLSVVVFSRRSYLSPSVWKSLKYLPFLSIGSLLTLPILFICLYLKTFRYPLLILVINFVSGNALFQKRILTQSPCVYRKRNTWKLLCWTFAFSLWLQSLMRFIQCNVKYDNSPA